MNVTELLTIARKINNYEIDPVGGVKVLWTSTTEYKAVVPTGKRWFLYGGIFNRSVNSTASVYLYDSSDDILLHLDTFAAGTGLGAYPNVARTANIIFPWVMDAGEYVKISLGTAQDASAYATCMVLEVDI